MAKSGGLSAGTKSEARLRSFAATTDEWQPHAPGQPWRRPVSAQLSGGGGMGASSCTVMCCTFEARGTEKLQAFTSPFALLAICAAASAAMSVVFLCATLEQSTSSMSVLNKKTSSVMPL